MEALLDMLYPELRLVNARDREALLRRARETPFDTLELLGMAAALVVVTALTRYSASGLGEAFAAAVVNFAIAMPLLALGIAPFLVRRTRRGLRRQIDGRADA